MSQSPCPRPTFIHRQIIQETPDFVPYLPVSRLESDISWVIGKVAISCRLNFLTIKFQIFYFVWANVNMERFPIIQASHCNLSNNVAKYELFMRYIGWSESTNSFCTHDFICRAIWRHPYHFFPEDGLVDSCNLRLKTTWNILEISVLTLIKGMVVSIMFRRTLEKRKAYLQFYIWANRHCAAFLLHKWYISIHKNTPNDDK